MHDLTTIFGNAFDNAVEAAEKSKKKYIELFTDHRNNFDVIIIKNSCNESAHQHITEKAGGLLKSTKKNSHAHGYGMKSIKNAVKKYDGDLNREYNKVDNEFTLTIMVCVNK